MEGYSSARPLLHRGPAVTGVVQAKAEVRSPMVQTTRAFQAMGPKAAAIGTSP